MYGQKKVASTWHTFHGEKIRDTIYHHIADFALSNQYDLPVRPFSDTSAIKVVSFFYDHAVNRDIMLGAVDLLAIEYKKNKRVRFISISVDDDPAGELKKSAERYKAREKKWDFLSGSDTLVKRMARTNFYADALKDTTGAHQYIVSPMLILLDPSSRIRGYYDSANTAQISKLSDEIKVLITEELRKIKAP